MDYIKLSQDFIQEYFPDAQGAMLSGSAATGTMGPTSDLDLLIFYNDIQSHYRKLFYYKNQKIEAMVHRASTCYTTFESDRKRRNKSFLDLIVKGTIIKDTADLVLNVQKKAVEIYIDNPPLPFTQFEKELYHYILNNRLDDLLDCQDFHESYFIFNNLMYFLTKTFLIYRGQWSNKSDGKWQLRAIDECDPHFGKKLREAIDQFSKQENTVKITEITKELLIQLSEKDPSMYEAGILPQHNKIRKWCLIDLFYAEPHEEILADGIKPFIDELKQNHQIESAFFSRNYKNGSHISLYIICDPELFDQEIIPLAESHLGNYLSFNPSLRVVPDSYKRLPKKFQLFSNNSLQYYLFEVEPMKYVGSEGLRLFEKQFDRSSDFVLKLIDQDKTVDFNNKIGEVIKIHWAALHALGLSKEELSIFFSSYWDQWGNYQFSTSIPVFIFNDKVAHEVPLSLEAEEMLNKKYEQEFEKNGNQLETYLLEFWDGLNTDSIQLDENLKDYIENLKEIHFELKVLNEEGSLHLPEPKENPNSSIKILEKYPLWFFFKEFVHGLNNKLGIRPENERYMNFLMGKVTSTLEFSTSEEIV